MSIISQIWTMVFAHQAPPHSCDKLEFRGVPLSTKVEVVVSVPRGFLEVLFQFLGSR